MTENMKIGSIEALQRENLKLKGRLFKVESYLNQVIKQSMQNRENQSKEAIISKNKIHDHYQKFLKTL